MTQPRRTRTRLRKPSPLAELPKRGVYAGIETTSYDHPIYVGGDYYGDSAQIHLMTNEAEHLGRWLLKAAAYLKQRPIK